MFKTPGCGTVTLSYRKLDAPTTALKDPQRACQGGTISRHISTFLRENLEIYIRIHIYIYAHVTKLDLCKRSAPYQHIFPVLFPFIFQLLPWPSFSKRLWRSNTSLASSCFSISATCHSLWKEGWNVATAH